MISQEKLMVRESKVWVLLPLRLFLGITFVYAGIQKLTDPQFFQPSAAGYIGNQIAGFAAGSPLKVLLLQIAAPHAVFFGLLIAYGEIAIGFGTLFGILFRPATFFGVFLSLLFYLTATWRVYPYFYGADIVFTFCWLTLLINGPRYTGFPTVDELFFAPNQTGATSRVQQILLGTTPRTAPIEGEQSVAHTYKAPAVQRKMRNSPQTRALSSGSYARRTFLLGLLSGVVGVLGTTGILYALRGTAQPKSSAVTPKVASTATVGDGTSTVAESSTPAATSTITQANAVPINSAMNFTIPATGDPGVLIHLKNDQFVAYDAVCTHAGCQVSYDTKSELLLCPCHGAAFDPAQGATPVQPPANAPLTALTVHVDSATGTITVSA